MLIKSEDYPRCEHTTCRMTALRPFHTPHHHRSHAAQRAPRDYGCGRCAQKHDATDVSIRHAGAVYGCADTHVRRRGP